MSLELSDRARAHLTVILRALTEYRAQRLSIPPDLELRLHPGDELSRYFKIQHLRVVPDLSIAAGRCRFFDRARWEYV